MGGKAEPGEQADFPEVELLSTEGLGIRTWAGVAGLQRSGSPRVGFGEGAERKVWPGLQLLQEVATFLCKRQSKSLPELYQTILFLSRGLKSSIDGEKNAVF